MESVSEGDVQTQWPGDSVHEGSVFTSSSEVSSLFSCTSPFSISPTKYEKTKAIQFTYS